MDANMGWREAIVKVLKTSDGPMHYSAIAQAIIDRGYKNENVGATPAATVAANLSLSLKQDGDSSPFVRVARAMYALRGGSLSTAAGPETEDEPDEATEDAAQMGLINAFGMFWQRNDVYWLRVPRLLGAQQSGSSPVDFSGQAGVYLLYDGNRVIYVGRVTEPRLGSRLWEHTRDRLSGRWDRFSWFGVRGVNGEGELRPMPVAGIAMEGLIATLEALLIEGLEPPQNRRPGGGFNAVEFIQVPDETVVTQREKQLLAKMSEQIGLR